jgi:hypothetical protein
MADSLHDSLTDTHRPRQSSPSPSPSHHEETIARPRRLNLQNVGELEGLAESGQQGAEMSLHEENWLSHAKPSNDRQSSEQEHNQQTANGMAIDEGPPKSLLGSVKLSSLSRDELPVGASASSAPYAGPLLVQDQQLGTKREEQETSKELGERLGQRLGQGRKDFSSHVDVETQRQQEQTARELKAHQEQPGNDTEHQHGPPSIQANTLHTDVPPEVAAFITNEATQDHVSLLQDAASKGHLGHYDSAMGDGHSLSSADGQSWSGAAMPHQGGPSITPSESAAALEQAEQGVEVGGGFSDDGYETDSSATSQSLATSARQFIFEHGRRYHSYKADVNPYSFPNDDREQDREDLKHAMFLKLFNKTLHFAPVPATGAHVLDLGTGTGIWAVDCAYTHIMQ